MALVVLASARMETNVEKNLSFMSCPKCRMGRGCLKLIWH
jgi:hypothetical protein